jgi:SAM-dependent methyltransferase
LNPHEELEHLRSHDRALAMRRVLERVVRPNMRVLDAGCGVGLLALWAARAGASVVAVDAGQTGLARRLAEANRLADHVRWVRGDIARLQKDDLGPSFDLIVAPRWTGDPRRDDATGRLLAQLRERFLAPKGRLFPDRIVTSAVGCDWPEQDLPTRQRELRAELATMRGRYGLSFEPLLEELLREPARQWYGRRNPEGRLERSGARLLGRAAELQTLDLAREFETLPKSVGLPIGSPGTLNAVLFTQSLYFGEELLAETDWASWLSDPVRVEPGERVALALDETWRETNALSLSLHELRAKA